MTLLVVTGDKELNRKLTGLAKNVQARLNRTATRRSAKLVLDAAKETVPVKTGSFRRSLTVRAIPRSRKRIGYRVTQKEGSLTGKDKDRAFYGGFLELGYFATGRPRKHGRYATNPPSQTTTEAGQQREEQTLRKIVQTYRGQKFSIRQLRRAKKIPGRWLMRKAGKDKEKEAQELHELELKRLVDEL